MAVGAIGLAFRFDKLALVIVAMAIRTPGMLYGNSIPILMTGFAINKSMPPFQLVSCLAVIKGRQLFDGMKRHL